MSTPPASRWAQGGLAAAIGADDSPALHRSDTLAAGAGLCEPAAVDCLVQQAPGCIANLLSLGLNLDRQGETLSTTWKPPIAGAGCCMPRIKPAWLLLSCWSNALNAAPM